MKILGFIRSLSTEISQLKKRIKDLKLLEERERELEKLEQQLYGKTKRLLSINKQQWFAKQSM